MPPQSKVRLRWPAWLNASVLVAALALLISAINAYVTLIDRRDDLQAFVSASPTVFYNENGTVKLEGSFEITIFNLGNRNAVVTSIDAQVFHSLVDHPADCQQAGDVSKQVGWSLPLEVPAFTLKPGDASTLRASFRKRMETDPDGYREVRLEMRERDLVFCLLFWVLTPNGRNFSWLTVGQTHAFSRVTFHEGGVTAAGMAARRDPTTIYYSRWPFH